MKTKRILLAIVCLLVILGGLNYLCSNPLFPSALPAAHRQPVPHNSLASTISRTHLILSILIL